jgi:hypothetical protein
MADVTKESHTAQYLIVMELVIPANMDLER